jgi:hypothetical protein
MRRIILSLKRLEGCVRLGAWLPRMTGLFGYDPDAPKRIDSLVGIEMYRGHPAKLPRTELLSKERWRDRHNGPFAIPVPP